MIIWVNGPFGVGKTTVTKLLSDAIPDSAIFDTEHVGYMLHPILTTIRPVDDFQDWAPWRTLSVASIVELASFLGEDIIVPQTVVVREYWDELLDGLRAAGQEVLAVTLDVSADEHERRINTDAVEFQAAQWRRDRAADFVAARSWLAATSTIIDTSELSPAEVVQRILRALH